MSINISIKMDRRAALLAGSVVGEREVVSVTPEGIGKDLWPMLVNDLDMRVNPPALGYGEYAEATEACVRAVLEGRVARDAAEEAARRAQERSRLDEVRETVEAAEARLLEPLAPRMQYADPTLATYQTSWATADSFWGWTRELEMIGYIRPETFLLENHEEAKSLVVRGEAAIAKNKGEVAAANDAAFSAALPGLREAKAARELVVLEREAKAEAERQAAIAARAAKRLETGYWEKETLSYNERRHSSPWCARVTFPCGPKPVYAWGESTGKWGSAGMLRVECRPGDVIAWGQKDLRRPDKSDHHILRMQDDGRMAKCSQAAAWELWRARETTNSAPAAPRGWDAV